jgi:hypothetical protein
MYALELKCSSSSMLTNPCKLLQPNLAFNPTTNKWVMWWIFSNKGTTLGVVQAGVADAPGGPYTLANPNVTLAYPSFTSANLFVDQDLTRPDPTAATAYVVYSCRPPGVTDFTNFPAFSWHEKMAYT